MSVFLCDIVLKSWFHIHFDNVMIQFIINKKRDAQATEVNLLTRKLQSRDIIMQMIFQPFQPGLHEVGCKSWSTKPTKIGFSPVEH